MAALAFTLVAPLSLSAQDDNQSRGRGQGGPGGRFGGGMMGGGMMGGQSGDAMMIGLLREEPIRTELELMPDQVEALQKLLTNSADSVQILATSRK